MEFSGTQIALSIIELLYKKKDILTEYKMEKLDSLRWRYFSLYGLLLPEQSGKTTLCKHLAQSKKWVILDIDELCKSLLTPQELSLCQSFKDRDEMHSYNVIAHPKAKELLAKVADAYADKKVLLISSSKALFSFLKVPKANRLYLCPADSVVERITAVFGAERAVEYKAHILGYKQELKEYQIYESFESLHNKLVVKFPGLALKL
jgi:hypothetical protein